MDCCEAAIDSFREAAVIPEHWPRALDTLARALRADGATLVLKPSRPNSVVFSHSLEPFAQDYVQQFLHAGVEDPREARVDPSLRGGFMTDYHSFAPQEIAGDAYYQEFLVPRGLGWHAAAALPGELLISLKRGNRRGPYDGSDLAALNGALPWLRAASRAASLTWRSNFAGQLSAFDRIGRGAILIDARARVLGMNSRVQLGDGLDVLGGTLQVPHLTDRHRLARLLSAVLNPGTSSLPASTTVTLPRPSGRRPWLLDAIVCADAVRSLHSVAAALVLITDMERPTSVATDLLREIFGLTPTEAKLARVLATGRSLQHAATELGISVGHARQRLNTIFQKTGSCSQNELIALLGKLG